MANQDDGVGIAHLWDLDANWLLCWEVRGRAPNQFLSFYAGPPVSHSGRSGASICDPQVSGYWTAGRLEVETVGHIELNSATCSLLRKVMDKVRLTAAEVF